MQYVGKLCFMSQSQQLARFGVSIYSRKIHNTYYKSFALIMKLFSKSAISSMKHENYYFVVITKQGIFLYMTVWECQWPKYFELLESRI